MGSTTTGHRIEQTARTFSAWKVVATGVVVSLAWFAGQSGWLSISPSDRVSVLEAQSAAQGLRIDINERQLQQIRATQRFTIELLCVPLMDTPPTSDGDRILRTRCRDVLDGPQ